MTAHILTTNWKSLSSRVSVIVPGGSSKCTSGILDVLLDARVEVVGVIGGSVVGHEAVILSRQPEIVHAAVIIHLPLALAVRNLGTRIRQGNVWTKSPDEMLLAVLPGASALLTKANCTMSLGWSRSLIEPVMRDTLSAAGGTNEHSHHRACVGGVLATAQLTAAQTIMGAGTTSCGDWTRLRAFDGQQGHPMELAQLYQLHAWVDGFISGVNLAKHGQPDILLSKPGSAAMYAVVDNYCRSKPLDNVTSGAIALENELHSRAQTR